MKLSIITINYNDAAGLEKTLHSIIPHNIGEVELIVIDGGSTDTSLDVILHNKEHIDFYVSEKDSGIYNAMNKGIRKTNGEYLLFINSGDTLMQTADFNKIINEITGEDIIYYNLEIVEENNHYIKTYPQKLDFKYFVEDTLPHPASFIKKTLFDKFGYYREDLKIVSDWAFFMDCILLYGCSYKHINDYFSSFYIGGISSNPHNLSQLLEEKAKHLSQKYALYFSMYAEWKENRQKLYKLKTSASVRYLKKIGLLKWFHL